MARPSVDDTEEKPLDPAAERVRRKLVRFVAVNLGLLFLAVMAVLAAVVYKSMDSDKPAAEVASDIPTPDGAPLELDLPLPAGSRLVGHALSGNRVSLDVELAGGKRSLIVYDIAGRRIVARIALTPQ